MSSRRCPRSTASCSERSPPKRHHPPEPDSPPGRHREHKEGLLPELPDVETMRRYLQATSLHQEIADVEVHAPGVLPSDELSEQAAVQKLKEKLIARSFEATRRHGKWMFVALNDYSDHHLVLHFGMTGGLKYFKDVNEELDYDRVLFRFANGYQLAYLSQRKLGAVDVIDDVDRFIDRKGLGPDALDPAFDLPAFKQAVEGRRAMAKSVLMDQSTVAGIGNVYSDEILFQAGIHPRTKISKLDEETLESLFRTIKDVLQTAVEAQGRPEQFPDSFIGPHRYEGGTCPLCGTHLERVQVGSRYAYYCPNRQQRS
ncbi:MAG: Fpg/Nei family DNA glycosylase [Chloroflexota bacterium]